MRVVEVSEIMARIAIATVSDQIMVLRNPRNGSLDAGFANTVVAQKLLQCEHPDVVGVFHNGMDTRQIRKQLAAELLKIRGGVE